jgi:ArsR family transcriptional regulator
VSAIREGSTVVYTLATPELADLLVTARRILTDMLADQGQLLAELRAEVT